MTTKHKRNNAKHCKPRHSEIKKRQPSHQSEDNHKSQQRLEKEPEPKKQGWKEVFSFGALKELVVFLVGVFSCFGYYSFIPRISVSPSFPLDPQKAFTTHFEVANEGYFTLNNISSAMSIRSMKIVNGMTYVGSTNFSNLITKADNEIPTLQPAEKYTYIFPSEVNFGGKVESADMAIVVRFNTMWGAYERKYRYTVTKSTDEQYHWIPQPLSK